MKVEEVMNHTVYTCGPDDALSAPARLMWDQDIGCVVVVDGHNVPLGVVTDRDLLMCAYTTGRRLEDLTVSQAMSKELYSVQFGQPITAAEVQMRAKQVRRLVVLDRTGRLAGILSLNDLALAAGERREVKPSEVAAVLASISQPRFANSPARS